jgi:carbon-monoxide dehydrogenase large subunit
VILRSSVAHGRVLGVDGSAARAMPGVRAVFTAQDVITVLGALPLIPMRLDHLPVFDAFRQPVVAHDRVRYVGEPLAIIVADSAALAEDALEAMAFELESLPAVVDESGLATLQVAPAT